MAYNVANRFPPPPKYFAFYDPGTYQFEKGKIKPNTVPFLSKSPRKTGCNAILWTQVIYDAATPSKIPNITSLKSKKSRFPYEAFSAQDLEEILCKCGIESPCVCPVSEIEPEVICQGKVIRRLYKGPTPRSNGDGGLSAPCKHDRGFEIQKDGVQRRIRKKITDESPPFYDARVIESTAFYHGCKWSQQTSMRAMKSLEVRPGPAEYSLDREPTFNEICAEKVRAHKRKTCKQLRFIEMVQQQNIREGRPGPATYHPKSPRGTDLEYLGPKAARFPSGELVIHPGPADHWLRRDFDPVEPPEIPCHATLPEPSFFGVKAQRFKLQREQGPSPATYYPNDKLCQVIYCATTPFLSSAVRFKPDIIEDSDEEEETDKEAQEAKEPCPTPMWQFKSKTIRMRPLEKMPNEPSPADMSQANYKIKRSAEMQKTAPFYSSDGRFQPWCNYLPVHGRLSTPGPCSYNLEPPKCIPAFNRGPMFRAKRFPCNRDNTPAPNEYEISGGIETVLHTHNQKLTDNINNQHKFVWEPFVEPKSLSFEQREALLLQNCINLLEPDVAVGDINKHPLKGGSNLSMSSKATSRRKSKLLRTFLYSHPQPKYF
ncbi:uncharacterized protein LOC142986601 [Anticarsia gemmatalis]|uniref:uncharacterized protein LOC142986601 n=1 Tax=Anticarsia gemmatalis TaxID=129554 RepID=UPI003F765B1B